MRIRKKHMYIVCILYIIQIHHTAYYTPIGCYYNIKSYNISTTETRVIIHSLTQKEKNKAE